MISSRPLHASRILTRLKKGLPAQFQCAAVQNAQQNNPCRACVSHTRTFSQTTQNRWCVLTVSFQQRQLPKHLGELKISHLLKGPRPCVLVKPAAPTSVLSDSEVIQNVASQHMSSASHPATLGKCSHCLISRARIAQLGNCKMKGHQALQTSTTSAWQGSHLPKPAVDGGEPGTPKSNGIRGGTHRTSQRKVHISVNAKRNASWSKFKSTILLRTVFQRMMDKRCSCASTASPSISHLRRGYTQDGLFSRCLRQCV